MRRTPLSTVPERLARLETLQTKDSKLLEEVHTDVKSLLAAQNRSAGLANGLSRIAPWVAIIISAVAFVRS